MMYKIKYFFAGRSVWYSLYSTKYTDIKEPVADFSHEVWSKFGLFWSDGKERATEISLTFENAFLLVQTIGRKDVNDDPDGYFIILDKNGKTVYSTLLG